MARPAHTRKRKAAPHSEAIDNTGPTKFDRPGFAQPQPTPDPTKFEVKHPSDNPAYKQIDELNREHKLAPMPFPAPRGLPEPRLTLAEILGDNAAAVQRRIAANGQLVFHATGDTGSTRGPESRKAGCGQDGQRLRRRLRLRNCRVLLPSRRHRLQLWRRAILLRPVL